MTNAMSALRESLGRIDARESEVRAWQVLDREGALERARHLDASNARGALHGLPIGIKDIIDTADLPTALGFAPYARRQPHWDASCVALCRRAGAIVLGKTVTTEFAYFSPGKTRNPHDLRATPGGSSSGSAAAVADGMVPIALGTQTAGSIVRPAAFCGVVGYKASHGSLSLSGIRPFAESHDSLGVLTGNVALAERVRSVLAMEPAVEHAADSSLQPPRLGLCRTPHWERIDSAAQENFLLAAQRLASAGASVEEVQLPRGFGTLADDHRTVMAFEAARNYVYECEQHADGVSLALRELCAEGMRIAPEAYAQAQQRIDEGRRALPAAMHEFDAWFTPSALGEAPLAASTGDPLLCRIWTALHTPAVALPTGRGPRGLPLGIQLVAPKGSDKALLSVAAWCEGAIAWQWRLPTPR